MFSVQRLPSTDGSESVTDLQNFTNTFILSSAVGSTPVLAEIPKAASADILRQRRVHEKSRTGCLRCKKRRVKCNGATPCASCVRRGEQCQRVVRADKRTSILSPPSQAVLSSSGPADSNVNLLHLKLFHHFQTCTIQTLLFPAEIQGHILQLSFEFEFLMNAVLCVAARHLTILEPNNPTHSTAAARHLCRALSQLSDHSTSTHIDAFIATSTLVQYATWSSPDVLSTQYNGMGDLEGPKDSVFALSSSMKQVFLKNVPFASVKSSVFRPYMMYNPADKLRDSTECYHDVFSRCRSLFSHEQPLTIDLLDYPPMALTSNEAAEAELPETGTPDLLSHSTSDWYTLAISRLALLFCFLSNEQSSETRSPLLPEIVKYIFSFPVQCHGPFASMVQQSDPHALLLLYHFYRAARILLPPGECWWAHERSTVSEMVLKKWLIKNAIK